MKKLVLLFMFGLLACGPVKLGSMLAGGNIISFQGTDTLNLPSLTVDIIEETGKSLGYRVAGMDREKNMIGLNTQGSFAAKVFLGKFNEASITFIKPPQQEKWHVTYFVQGTHGSGTQKQADALWDSFKEELLEKIK